MRYFSIAFILSICVSLTTQAYAATWGPSKPSEEGFDKAATLDKYYDLLSRSPNEEISKNIFKDLWQTWMIAPDAIASEGLNQAMRARGGYEFDKALTILDGMIEQYPNFEQLYAERSYVHFLKDDFSRSLTDCEKVLEFDDQHLGCLTGMARILIRKQHRYKAGKSVLDKTVAIHPYVYEQILYNEIPVIFKQ
jgi:tetratricopeptide (TPR) repeat protein